METLHKTFSKDLKKSKEKLKELELLVDRIIDKVRSFSTVQPKEQKAIRSIVEKNQKSQLNDQSLLMEDLYKILPLTVDTAFEQAASAIVCIFDTA